MLIDALVDALKTNKLGKVRRDELVVKLRACFPSFEKPPSVAKVLAHFPSLTGDSVAARWRAARLHAALSMCSPAVALEGPEQGLVVAVVDLVSCDVDGLS